MITKDRVFELADSHGTNYVSIYIPTHRAGKETVSGKDALILKNQVSDIKLKLGEQGMSVQDIDKFVKPVNELVNDHEFWSHQSDGLAIFLSDDLFDKYSLPIYFEAFNCKSSKHFGLVRSEVKRDFSGLQLIKQTPPGAAVSG